VWRSHVNTYKNILLHIRPDKINSVTHDDCTFSIVTLTVGNIGELGTFVLGNTEILGILLQKHSGSLLHFRKLSALK
jgi:hypothetical protein